MTTTAYLAYICSQAGAQTGTLRVARRNTGGVAEPAGVSP
jgi:hypothetical protein